MEIILSNDRNWTRTLKLKKKNEFIHFDDEIYFLMRPRNGITCKRNI